MIIDISFYCHGTWYKRNAINSYCWTSSETIKYKKKTYFFAHFKREWKSKAIHSIHLKTLSYKQYISKFSSSSVQVTITNVALHLTQWAFHLMQNVHLCSGIHFNVHSTGGKGRAPPLLAKFSTPSKKNYTTIPLKWSWRTTPLPFLSFPKFP